MRSDFSNFIARHHVLPHTIWKAPWSYHRQSSQLVSLSDDHTPLRDNNLALCVRQRTADWKSRALVEKQFFATLELKRRCVMWRCLRELGLRVIGIRFQLCIHRTIRGTAIRLIISVLAHSSKSAESKLGLWKSSRQASLGADRT